MYMDVGMDTGDIILKEETLIGKNETTGELWKRLSKMGANLLVETLKQIEKNTAPRIKQSEEYTLAPMLDKKIARINWEEKDAKQIKNLVRGLNPIMGAYTFLNNKKIKFWKVEVLNKEKLIEELEEFKEYEYRLDKIQPGTVLYVHPKQGLYIKAKDDIISVKEIQGENAKRMDIFEFLKGNKIQMADIFE